jgi:hypothetical protein
MVEWVGPLGRDCICFIISSGPPIRIIFGICDVDISFCFTSGKYMLIKKIKCFF